MNVAWKAAFAAALLAASALFFVREAPATPGATLPHTDKLAHFALFLALAALAVRAFPARSRAFLLVALLLYGLAVEIVQPSVGRHFEWLDLAADAVGAAVGVIVGRRSQQD